MFPKNEESYFDKYLKDILDLFDNIDQDVVVFEDIDRFDCIAIFERLREVNLLVNHSRQNKKPPIKFLYLIRDDIFINKERLKFFDLIIPVVPIVDGSNSYDKFIEVFKLHGILEQFSSELLQGFSFYVDDMRLLINICNEYKVYLNQLLTVNTEIDCNKLLAMISYKNIFPQDFSELQLGKGFIYTLLSSKDELIQKEKMKLENEIILLKSTIKSSENEHLQNEQEIDVIYKAQLDNAKAALNRVNYEPHRTNAQNSLDEVMKKVSQRKENINNRTHEERNKLLNKIDFIGSKLSKLHQSRIKDLLLSENIEEIFNSLVYVNPLGIENNFEAIKNNHYFSLLKYFIRNGFIDETYKDYMTYFYPNSLSANDAIFCRSVTDQKAKPVEYIINNPKMVVNRIPSGYFNQKEVLNYSLLDYLLSLDILTEQLKLIIVQLKDGKCLDFIRGYFANGKYIDKFVEITNSIWNEMFKVLLDNKVLTEEQLKLFAIYTIYLSKDDIIKAINIDNCLTLFISNSSNFLNITNPQIDKIIYGLKLIKTSFTAIEMENVHEELLYSVYRHNLYNITIQNISIMLQKYYEYKPSSDFYHKNYSLVMKKLDSPLSLYINKNINIYFDEILKNCKNMITDDYSMIIKVLNNETIETKLKQLYISFLKTTLKELTEIIDKTLWEGLLKSDEAIIYSESNVSNYFFYADNKFDDILVNWINKQTTILDFSNDDIFNKDESKRIIFSDEFIACSLMKNEHYSYYSATIGYKYEIFNFENIEDEKMKILIDNHIIIMNSENLKFIRINYSFDILCFFICHEIDLYTELLDNNIELLNNNEIEFIISNNSSITEIKQIKILKITDSKISIKNKGYSENIEIHILLHNYFEDDLNFIIDKYNLFSEKLKKIALKILVSQLEKIIQLGNTIPISVFEDLLNSGQLTDDQKISLLIFAMPNLDDQDCIKYLNMCGFNQFADIYNKNKKPQFENTKNNKLLLNCFVRQKKIERYNIAENGKIYISRF